MNWKRDIIFNIIYIAKYVYYKKSHASQSVRPPVRVSQSSLIRLKRNIKKSELKLNKYYGIWRFYKTLSSSLKRACNTFRREEFTP